MRPQHRARLVKCREEVAGDNFVEAVDLTRVIGPTARRVYNALLLVRNAASARNGVVRPLRSTLGRLAGGDDPTKVKGLHHSGVERALRRLEAAGLVRSLGWQRHRVENKLTGRDAWRGVYVREVLGAMLLKRTDNMNERDEYLVPDATAEFMRAYKPTRGGARMGAGRPSKTPTSPRAKKAPGIQNRAGAPLAANSKPGRLSTSVDVRESEETRFSLSPSEKEKTGAGGAPSFSSHEGPQEPEVLTGGSGAFRPTLSVLAVAHREVPAYPGQAVVAPAFIPHPPLLDADLTPVQLALKLMAAYRGAMNAVFGGRCNILARGDISKAKGFKNLVAFAGELIAHEIPPAVWCYFAAQSWKAQPASAGRPKLPPLSVVFNLDRIETKRRWQFRQVWGDGKIGGTAVFGKKHRELLARYQRLAHALAFRPGEAAAAVAEAFPGDLYEELLDAARLEAKENRIRLESKIAKGEFVW